MRRAHAAALVLLLAGAIPARAEPGQYAISRIKVLNGNPIRGFVGNEILPRSFGPECQLAPLIVAPLSTALGASTALEVEIISCPAGLPPPRVSCRLKVGEIGSEVSCQAWKQVLPLVLPDRTGIFPVALDCSFDGQDGDKVDTKLYLTYQRPTSTVNIVQPPQEGWYETACSWAEGLDATSTQADVLQRILSAMYRYGQHNWRYGYCQVQGDKRDRCVFGATNLEARNLICNPFSKPEICKCPWSELIVKDGPCNFANCFTFSDVLTYLSGVMGVGGLGEISPKGALNRGFATQPWLRSFDPAFPGNLACGSRDLPCSYVFDVHSLLLFGNLFYDATFGQTYHKVEDLIAGSVLQKEPGGLVFRDFLACAQKGPGYGQWPIYQERPRSAVCMPAAEGAATFDERVMDEGWSARFGPASQIRVTLKTKKQPSPGMTVRVEVPVLMHKPERFIVEGRLERISTGETVAYAAKPFPQDAADDKVTLDFQSRQIDELGNDGRYIVTLVLHRAQPLSRLDSVQVLFDPTAGRPEQP